MSFLTWSYCNRVQISWLVYRTLIQYQKDRILFANVKNTSVFVIYCIPWKSKGKLFFMVWAALGLFLVGIMYATYSEKGKLINQIFSSNSRHAGIKSKIYQRKQRTHGCNFKKKKKKKKETIATEGQIIVKTRHNYVTIRTTFLFTFLLPKPHVSPRNFTKIRISLGIWHESILGL